MGGDCCCGRDRSSGGSGTRVQDHGSALQVESSKDDTEGGRRAGRQTHPGPISVALFVPLTTLI